MFFNRKRGPEGAEYLGKSETFGPMYLVRCRTSQAPENYASFNDISKKSLFLFSKVSGQNIIYSLERIDGAPHLVRYESQKFDYVKTNENHRYGNSRPVDWRHNSVESGKLYIPMERDFYNEAANYSLSTDGRLESQGSNERQKRFVFFHNNGHAQEIASLWTDPISIQNTFIGLRSALEQMKETAAPASATPSPSQPSPARPVADGFDL